MSKFYYTTTDPRYKLKRAHADDAGYDLVSAESVTLAPGEQRVLPTPFRVQLPPGHVGLIRDRSSLAARRLCTHAGVIDAGFRGVVGVLLENRSQGDYIISAGDRVAQLLVVPVFTGDPLERDTLPDSERGTNGWGSTGV